MKQSLVCKLLVVVLLSLTVEGTSMASAPIESLRRMIGQDHVGLALGVADPALRAELNSKIDAAARSLSSKAAAGASKEELLEEMGVHLNAIDRDALDTDDAEKIASAFEAMLEPLGLGSSHGLLNTWMYGFDPS